MTKTENVILNSIKARVSYFQKNNFDKYVIIDYIDGNITRTRCKISDELLRHLFDIRQKVLLGKNI